MGKNLKSHEKASHIFLSAPSDISMVYIQACSTPQACQILITIVNLHVATVAVAQINIILCSLINSYNT